MAVLLLTEVLSEVPDPRRAQGTRHPLPGVLALMTMAIMCGCRSLYAIAQWGRDHGPEMAEQLGLKPKHRTPAVSTLHELFNRLNARALEAALRRWASSWLPAVDELAKAADLEPISIDGKSLRGSHGHEVPAVHLLAAYATRLGLVLNQVKADATKEEGGEIIAAPKLLKDLVLQGRIVIGDAIHAQRDLCAQIGRQGGEYLFVVKENQPTLHRELVDLFRSPSAPLLSTARPTRTADGSRNGR